MSTPNRPNILILLPHDLGDFLGCYGHPSVHSPSIDRMAKEGVVFTHCFTPSPECSPSRGCLFTGLMPHQNGLMGLSNFGWSLRVPHLAERLRDLGYATHQFGFQHETSEPAEALGYQHTHRDGSIRADVVCRDICAFLRKKEDSDEQPWFACAGFSHVHRRWADAEKSSFSAADVDVPPWLPDKPEVRRDLARFHHDISELDAAVDTVRQTLEETGLGKKPLLIFTTDHGAAFPGAKATLYDPGIHVPLILHWPGHVEGGTRHDQLVSNMDVCPSLIELAGGSPLAGLAGRSFAPLLKGEAYRERESVDGALFYDVAYDPMHYVRTATHKYIRSFAVDDQEAVGVDPEMRSTFAAGRWIRVDDFDVLTSPTWQALAPDGTCPLPEKEELYDLENDPMERTNLAGNAAAEAVLQNMRCRLQDMMTATESPLLKGHVPPPEKQRAAARGYGPRTERSLEEIGRRKALQ